MSAAGGPGAPAVSVLVPTYRAGGYLVELCDSLLAQTRRDFEVVILSDGCDDLRQEGMRRFAADGRFRFLEWSPNRGVAAATDRLLGEVRAPFWCYPGADDRLAPEFIARRLAVMDRASAVNAIFGRGIQIDPRGAECWYHPLRVVMQRLGRFDGQCIPPARMLRVLLQENVINTPSVFFRSAATLPVLRGRGCEWTAQDHYYWIQLAAAGGFYYDDAVLHAYRIHPESSSRGAKRLHLRLAEFRLVPLVALSEAAARWPVAEACWREWREDLYDLWIARGFRLLLAGGWRSAWHRRAAAAYRRKSCGAVTALADIAHRLPRARALRRAEQVRAGRQVWVHGLRKIDDPIFREPDES